MATGYKEYNNYSQQDKDSIRTMDAELSNQNETTIIGQTDELEGLIKTTNNKLDTLAGKLDTLATKLDTIAGYVDQLETKVDAVTTAVGNADTHIVAAIQALPHDQAE